MKPTTGILLLVIGICILAGITVWFVASYSESEYHTMSGVLKEVTSNNDTFTITLQNKPCCSDTISFYTETSSIEDTVQILNLYKGDNVIVLYKEFPKTDTLKFVWIKSIDTGRQLV